MTLGRSLLFFGLPGLAIFTGLNWGVPWADGRGIPLIVSWTIALWGPVLTLLAWVLLTEKHTFAAMNWRDRYWIKPVTRHHMVIVVVAFVVLQVAELGLSLTASSFADLAFLPIPPIIPDLFDPYFDITAGLQTFLGVSVEGNWWLILFWLGWLVINIGGEEFLWRGYALPLQERVFGRGAWLVNGLCWNLLIHAFMWWNVFVLMPLSLAVPYLVQRYRNIWIGVWLHGLGNLLVLVVLIPSVAGWG